MQIVLKKGHLVHSDTFLGPNQVFLYSRVVLKYRVVK